MPTADNPRDYPLVPNGEGDIPRATTVSIKAISVDVDGLTERVQTVEDTPSNGITVSTADGNSVAGVIELRLPAGMLETLSPGVVLWTPSAGGTEDA